MDVKKRKLQKEEGRTEYWRAVVTRQEGVAIEPKCGGARVFMKR